MYISPNKILGHLDRVSAWQRGEKPAPVTVEWDLSLRCSLGCQGCHFAHTHTRGPWSQRQRDMPLGFQVPGDLADPALVCRGLGEMAEAGVLAVIWSGGGEPTLHPQWLDILGTAAELGLEQGMYTLGGHLTPETAAHLAGLATWVVVSLDCADRETYAREKACNEARFEAACNGLLWLAESGRCIVGASFLLHEGNWHRTREMLELADSLGATYSTFRPTILTSPTSPSECTESRSWVEEALSVLAEISELPNVECDVSRFEQYRDWSGRSYGTCFGIRFNATVTPDGRVWVCPQRRGVEGSCVGDLSQESFEDLWSRHVGEWTDFSGCRVMCRLHQMNQVLAEVYAPREHVEFV